MSGHEVGRSSSVTVSTVVFLLGILLLIEPGVCQKNERCSPERIQMCQIPLTKLSEKGQVVAINKEQLIEVCGVLKPVVQCMQGILQECSEMGGMKLDQMFSGVTSTLNNLCDIDSQFSKDYLRHAPCMSEVDNRVATCSRVKTKDRTSSSDNTDIIDQICCAMKSALTCTREIYNEHCGAEASEMGYQMVTTMLGPMVQNTCVDSYGNFKCSGCNSLFSMSPVMPLLSLATLYFIFRRINHF